MDERDIQFVKRRRGLSTEKKMQKKSRAVAAGSLLAEGAPAVVELCRGGHSLGGVVVRIGRPSGIRVSCSRGRRSEFGRGAGLVKSCQGRRKTSRPTDGVHVVCDQQGDFQNLDEGKIKQDWIKQAKRKLTNSVSETVVCGCLERHRQQYGHWSEFEAVSCEGRYFSKPF